jgi:hypothetical protein
VVSDHTSADCRKVVSLLKSSGPDYRKMKAKDRISKAKLREEKGHSERRIFFPRGKHTEEKARCPLGFPVHQLPGVGDLWPGPLNLAL